MKQVRCHDRVPVVCVVCKCVGRATIAPLPTQYVGMAKVVSYVGLITMCVDIEFCFFGKLN